MANMANMASGNCNFITTRDLILQKNLFNLRFDFSDDFGETLCFNAAKRYSYCRDVFRERVAGPLNRVPLKQILLRMKVLFRSSLPRGNRPVPQANYPVRSQPIVLMVAGFACASAFVQSAFAGMPSPELVVSELGKRRLEEVSFFLIGFLLLTAICRALWNGLATDVPVLPKLSYRGALCMMLLWGLALTVVLSLVSGARELMTPAAWEPNGITHRLVGSKSKAVADELAERRSRLETLKRALWDYAANHESDFPTDVARIPHEIVVADTISGLPFQIQTGLKTTSPRTVLASEPDIYPRRLLLLTDGAIVVEVRRESGAP